MAAADRPAIAGFFPDPTLCRRGTELFLAHSSFEYFPGAPIFSSSDLLDWTAIGNILTRRSQFDRGDGRASGGIFGSTLRYHDGLFWFITTNMSRPGSGHTVVHSDDPAGPWSEPVFIVGAIGIDPDLAWDDDGSCYLSYVGFGPTPEQSGIVQARVDLATGTLLDTPTQLWQGTGMAYPEGPHLYRRGDYWYLLLAEGGTERGHSVTVARGPSPSGPFEPCPSNPVLTHRGWQHPVQNVGHADLVELADGSWAAAYLGVRPRGVTPGFHVNGRETFLAGIDWVDDWPVFVEGRYEPAAVDHSFSDDFGGATLDPRWVVPAGEAATVASAHPGGGLTVRSGPLCVRARDEAWTATATFDSAAASGARLLLRIDERHEYSIDIDGDRALVRARIGDAIALIAEAPAASAGESRVLRISAVPPADAGKLGVNVGPDEIVLGVVRADVFDELARLDGRYLSTEVAGGCTGRVIGLGATGDPVRLIRVDYHSDGTR